MDNDLYFISLIEQAIQQKPPHSALIQAFETIMELGQKTRYQNGYRQYEKYMETIIQLSQPAKMIESQEESKEGVVIPEKSLRILFLMLNKNGELLERIPLGTDPFTKTISAIEPGDYVLCLDTGRVLWRKYLGEKHVQWYRAFPDQPLPFAAKTEEQLDVPATVAEKLLNDEIHFQVIPGIETGTFKIKIQQPE